MMLRPCDPDIQETNRPITSSIGAEALWYRLPDSSTADETVQGSD